jgi:thiol:disulfide interchange protein
MQLRFSNHLFCLAALAGPACFSPSAGAAEASTEPFRVSVATRTVATGSVVQVDFTITPGCVLYAERLRFLTPGGKQLNPLWIAEPAFEWDDNEQQKKKVYEAAFTATLNPSDLEGTRLVVKFQGCTNGACFTPEKHTFAMRSGGSFVLEPDDDGQPSEVSGSMQDVKSELGKFRVIGRQTGYLKASDFIGFLDRAATGQAEADPLARFRNLGVAATIVLIVLGGFLLNLTPCVLPMIPINLTIIGAGSKARSRVAGFKSGGVYGLGMALAYGTLGLLVVLTGAKFGALNSSVWFNVVIALIFAAMALAMFDVVNIDLSRFNAGIGEARRADSSGALLRNLVVFSMGGVAALLAGACVAPVVVSVMLLSANLYAKGLVVGLLLPFLLGIGMALPWPLAGAGLAVLPRPGGWMKRVKYGFGVIILLFSVYYGHLGFAAYASGQRFESIASAATQAGDAGQEDPTLQLQNALIQSADEHRQLFIDFHASWCKNCVAMDQTVFNQPLVQRRLKDFIVLRYDAERPNQSPAKEVLDHFGVMGLPTYLLLSVDQGKIALR